MRCFVQFSVSPLDYGCLSKHVDRTSAAFPPLLNAYLQLDTTAWLITCRALDGIRILQLAKKAGPNAASAIVSGIHKSSANRQIRDRLDRLLSIVLLTAPSLRGDSGTLTSDCPVKGRCAGEAQDLCRGENIMMVLLGYFLIAAIVSPQLRRLSGLF
jgi:hypothetical protein